MNSGAGQEGEEIGPACQQADKTRLKAASAMFEKTKEMAI